MINQYTALYSDLDRKYQQEYSGRYEDLSVKTDKGEIVAAIKNNKITGFGRPMVCVGADDFQKEQIERLWGVCPDLFYQDFLVDGVVSPITKFLLKQGYGAEPYLTQIIDLTKTEKELHADLRKSYKSLVGKPTEIYHDINCLKKLHFKCAGRLTRPEKTWFIQQEMIETNRAFVIQSDRSAALFYHNGDCAYYAVSAGEFGHPIIWRAMSKLKKFGVKFLEMGEQIFNGDEKEINISKFKRGFGGKMVCRLNLTK